MNIIFSPILLKIERDSVMPGTRIPTGKNKRVEYTWHNTLYDACNTIRDLHLCPNVIRVTFICKEKQRGGNTFVKTDICTYGEKPFMTHSTTREERIARTAIIPAEVIRETTRAAQS